MKKMNGFVSKSVAALALLGALPAAAGQATYSGALCTSVDGFGAPTIFRSGRLLNQSAANLEVVCPLQRNVVAPSFTEDMTVSVTVVDPHLNENVCCTATVAEADGTALTSGSACSSGADVGNSKTFSINLASVFASTNGYLSLRCVLPEQYSGHSSVLASFLVTE